MENKIRKCRKWTSFEKQEGWIEFNCVNCGVLFYRNPSRLRTKNIKHAYCSVDCRRLGARNNPPNWKGGKWTSKYDGYTRIFMPEHPRAKNGYALEHVLVVEKDIGRFLDEKTELVHHRNGVRDDNRIENLMIVSRNNHYGEIECPHCHKVFVIH